jgi:hypothetical protein
MMFPSASARSLPVNRSSNFIRKFAAVIFRRPRFVLCERLGGYATYPIQHGFSKLD